MFVMAFNSYDTSSVCTIIVTNVILDSWYLFYAVHLPTIFLAKCKSFHKGISSFLLICLQPMYAVKDDRFCFKIINAFCSGKIIQENDY